MGELQKRLQQAEHLAAVGRMSAQVAHEVGNPLHSIGLEAELALEVATQVKNPSLKSSAQSILKSVERLQNIIQNYLRLSSLTPGQKSAIDLKEVIESSLATYANSLQQLKIKVNWKFDSNLSAQTRVMGDSDLLEYAIGNLLRNSIQALETKSEAMSRQILIQIGSLDRNRVRFIFQDNGPGISAEVQPNLFKPFFTTKAQGTGLGLSFVKKVFTDLGGDFFLRSSDVGQGVIFEGHLNKATGPELFASSEKPPFNLEGNE